MKRRAISPSSIVAVLGVCVVLSAAAPVRADMDETFDLSAHAVRSRMAMDDPRVDSLLEMEGAGARLGWSLEAMRFGAGLGVYGQSGLSADAPRGARAFVASGEAFIAYAPNGFWSLRPSLELRLHVDRLQVGDAFGITRVGVGPRVGVIAPLSEYLFVDCGIGLDAFGSDEIRATIGLGVPIPLSHL